MSGILSGIGGVISGVQSLASNSLVQSVASLIPGAAPWLAMLRQASFRGAGFHVEQGSAASGRRAALHEYPGRDIPYAEDLGRKQWAYSFTAYCIGTFYPMQRDALLRACTAKGPGTLVHPSFGSKQVICTDCSVQEERQSGNYCSFSLTFVEAGQLQEPTSTTNTTAAIEGKAATATTASVTDFSSKFGVLGQIESTVTGAIQDVKTFVNDTVSLVVSPLQDLGNTFTSALGDLGINASALVYAAPTLAAKVQGLTGAYGAAQAAAPVVSGMLTLGSLFTSHDTSSAAKPAGAVNALTNPAAREAALVVPPILSVARQREADNAAAFQMLVRQSALIEVAYAVPGLSLASSQDAFNLRVAISDAFEAAETAAGNAGLDASYTALVDLENAVLSDITQRMLQLPALTTYRLQESPNSIALAWRLYQNANREAEPVDRTNAINPSFLPRSGRVLSA